MNASEPLPRAIQHLRETDEPGWFDLSSDIMSKVRTFLSPSDPILIRTTDGATTWDRHGSVTHISSRVVIAVLRQHIPPTADYALTTIDLDTDNEELTGLHITATGAYGTDLHLIAERIRAAARTELDELFNQPTTPHINVTVDDITDHDPRTLGLTPFGGHRFKRPGRPR